MKTLWISALFLLLAGNAPESAVAQEKLIQLEGLLTDYTGGVIPGVSVVISGEGASQSTVSGDTGRWSFRIPAGRYDLDFQLLGFVQTRLLQVDIPKQPDEPLLVVLPRLILERHPGVVDSVERVEAPPLDLAFVPDGAPRVGGTIRGKLIIGNIGERAFEVPTRHQPVRETKDPTHLALSLSMSCCENPFGAAFTSPRTSSCPAK